MMIHNCAARLTTSIGVMTLLLASGCASSGTTTNTASGRVTYEKRHYDSCFGKAKPTTLDGRGADCVKVGDRFNNTDARRALEFYSKSCLELNSAEGCTSMLASARSYYKAGRISKAEFLEIRARGEQICLNSSPVRSQYGFDERGQVCTGVAISFMDVPDATDKEKADTYVVRGCMAGHMWTCNGYAARLIDKSTRDAIAAKREAEVSEIESAYKARVAQRREAADQARADRDSIVAGIVTGLNQATTQLQQQNAAIAQQQTLILQQQALRDQARIEQRQIESESTASQVGRSSDVPRAPAADNPCVNADAFLRVSNVRWDTSDEFLRRRGHGWIHLDVTNVGPVGITVETSSVPPYEKQFGEQIVIAPGQTRASKFRAYGPQYQARVMNCHPQGTNLPAGPAR